MPLPARTLASAAGNPDAAVAGHPGLIDYWQHVAGPLGRARRWCEAHQRDILAAAR